MPVNKRIPLIFGVPQTSFFDGLKVKKAFVAELRPGLEGIKIVAGELLKRHIQPVVICDNMLAFCMGRGLVKDVHIFCNAVNKSSSLCRTGSLIAALCAKRHKIPVYLYPAANLFPQPVPLHKINGMRVTSSAIKTYVPLFEEVPLTLVRR